VDVARAIRYAVDNGAQIVNMSFGKGYSPAKASVDSAVRYAESRGVLLVHAAGNEGENNDDTPSYPTPLLAGGTRAANWIEVGASSWKPLAALPAEFSNYGREQVDLFAPGVDILSTVPGGGLKRESGTSMAAPVVSGVAALLMAYFPELTAMQVRDILLESVRKLPDLEVRRPGDGSTVKFTALSRTGGVIDAYAAVKLALQRVAPRP
jgi:subtilisin family serine protease